MKYIIVFLLGMLIFPSTSVGNIEFKRHNGEIYLVTRNCKKIATYFKEIKSWGELYKKSCQFEYAISGDSRPFKKGDCYSKITSCLPDQVVKYHDTSPLISGPNCWNLSLVLAELLPHLRYTEPHEMSFFMSSPLCRKILKNEKKEPGDIGAIRGKSDTKFEIHGFIYVSDNIAYSKNGYSNENSYALQTLQNVYKTYQLDDENEECFEENLDYSCMGVEFYRCSSMKDFLKEKKIEKKISNVKKYVDQIDCYISKVSFNKENSSSNQFLNVISDSVLALNEYLKNELIISPLEKLSEQEVAIMGEAFLRVDSLTSQIDILRGDQISDANLEAVDNLYTLMEQSLVELHQYRNIK